MSCLVHVIEIVEGRDDAMAEFYRSLSDAGLVRPTDALTEAWLKRIGCMTADTVLDPFMGSGGTAAASGGGPERPIARRRARTITAQR